jgi:hypothetical protein
MEVPSARRQAKQTHLPRQTSPDVTPTVSPFAWLPYYLSPEEMEAVWREWGWRVLGQEPVAPEDREAFETVCRQLQTNWGTVYRPVALLAPMNPTASPHAQVRLFNQCLAAGWQLQREGLALTAVALALAAGEETAVVAPLLEQVVATLNVAELNTSTGGT